MAGISARRAEDSVKPLPDILPRRARQGPLRLRLLRCPQQAEPMWRDLESRGAATPFQRFDWMDAWFRHARDAEGGVPLIMLADRGGVPELLIALELKRQGLVTVARLAGGAHANLGAPIVAPGADIDPAELTDLLCAAAAEADIDLFHFTLLPAALAHGPNPLVALPQAVLSSEDLFSLKLDGPMPVRSREHRRKLQQKRRRLADLGRLSLRKACCPGGVDRALSSFLAQKADRFATIGLQNPFARPGIADFLRSAALANLDQGHPALELFWLELDDTPVAVFGAASDGRRLSGMLLSFTQAPAIARCSPGILLLDAVIADAAIRGLEVVDLGPGEARYKREFATTRETLFDVALPVTAIGRLASRAAQFARASKRAIRRCSALCRTFDPQHPENAALDMPG
jgi:CelD/BcsL family acetyltransferase involved in cellulose biosynthesis